jgi:hypothetical protein
MLTAELGIVLLISRSVTLMTAAGENLTNTDDEMRICLPADRHGIRPTLKRPGW